MNSPIKYPGGKSKLWKKIIPYFPKHEIYVEPFLGGGSILLNKEPCNLEIGGDTNENLIKMWEYIKRQPYFLVDGLKALKYANYTLQFYKDLGGEISEFVVRNMSRGGEGIDFSWSERSRGGMGGDENAWVNKIELIPTVSERLKKTVFYYTDAISLICRFDSANTFFYCDPPYLHETRVSKELYGIHEMSRDDHVGLATALLRCRGKVCLSGYPSLEYTIWFQDWNRVDIPTTTNSSYNERTECLWMNY